MKKNKRTFQVLNFLALNLLFFSLYLNFIHKDNDSLPPVSSAATTVNTTVLVKNPEQYLHKEAEQNGNHSRKQTNNSDVKASFN